MSELIVRMIAAEVMTDLNAYVLALYEWPDGSGERIMTEGFHNEGPTWAPTGRYMMFFRDACGASGARLFMVDTTVRVEMPVPTPSYGSDPAWSPLLN